MVFSRKLTRAKLLNFFAGQPACVVALEACGGAHHCARELETMGHEVRLISPAYVKPFVKLCSPRHNFTNHEVPIMRRNAA
ncbi:transposase [Novosphingobium subterraneum]|uniref:Transposase n=1 Tax=Novosphingobium subterraneum TaxID=48936 RepID=A0A0B8ZWT2_9SPHN|nr:transposase [Novosphingobium subterraneum]